MKRYSYSFLIPTTVSFVALVSGFIYWQIFISRMTYLHSSLLSAIVITALLCALVTTLLLMRRIMSKTTDAEMRFKQLGAIFIGSTLLVVFISYFILSLLTWLLPGEESYYSATYTYASGGRNSCSGADVDDPDLQKEVRVCYPIGDYYSKGVIVVHKRTNALGAVMIDGRILP